MIKNFMRTGLMIAAFGMVLSLSIPSANANVMFFRADLSRDNVLGSMPGESDATGLALLKVNTITGLFDLSLDIVGIDLADSTFAGFPFAFGEGNLGPIHIHLAPRTANGGIVVPFPDEAFYSETTDGYSLDVSGGTFDLTLLPALLNQGLYFNVHTQDFAGGEIRGQIVSEPGMLALFGTGLLGLALIRRRRLS